MVFLLTKPIHLTVTQGFTLCIFFALREHESHLIFAGCVNLFHSRTPSPAEEPVAASVEPRPVFLLESFPPVLFLCEKPGSIPRVAAALPLRSGSSRMPDAQTEAGATILKHSTA